MRLTVLPPFTVAGAATLAEAMDRVFGDGAMRRLHGSTLTHTPWTPAGHMRMERSLRFEIEMKGVPHEVRRFICGDRLRISARQRASYEARAVNIDNKMRMHFVGRELFIVRPRYRLQETPTGVDMHAEVENHAMLPPPLCHVIEGFMDASAREQLERFGSYALPPPPTPSDESGPDIVRIALGLGGYDGC